MNVAVSEIRAPAGPATDVNAAFEVALAVSIARVMTDFSSEVKASSAEATSFRPPALIRVRNSVT
jgi:hypothetical protein